MKLSAPKTVVWVISLVIAVLALLSALGVFSIPGLAGHAFWVMTVAWLILLLATLLKGL